MNNTKIALLSFARDRNPSYPQSLVPCDHVVELPTSKYFNKNPFG